MLPEKPNEKPEKKPQDKPPVAGLPKPEKTPPESPPSPVDAPPDKPNEKPEKKPQEKPPVAGLPKPEKTPPESPPSSVDTPPDKPNEKPEKKPQDKPTPAGQPPDKPDDNPQGYSKFEQEALEAHNKFRLIHEVPPITLNDELSKKAADYAKIIAAKGSLEHEKNQKDGENLAMKCNSPGEKEASGSFFTTMWYEEVCKPGYDFTSGKFDMQTGHFTQVVWKDTKELGIGKATGKSEGYDCTFVVARYKPPGNFQGKFQSQVQKGKFDPSICSTLEQTSKRRGVISKYKVNKLVSRSSTSDGSRKRRSRVPGSRVGVPRNRVL